MKKSILAFLISISFASCDVLHSVAKEVLTIPTSEEAAGGLKDALVQGFSKGADALSVPGAFNNNSLIRILLPPDAQKVADKLRQIGMNSQVDKVINEMNAGAENAAATAKPIFVDAVRNMSFSDAMSVLTGGNGAATRYLKENTTSKLTEAFRPVIQKSLDQVGFTRNWTDLVNAYNKIPFIQQMNPDLNAYISEKALTALFNKVETEENLIRQDPAARATELMKKAFAYADTRK